MPYADRAEFQLHEDGDTFLWDGDAWYGGDIDKFWIKSDGEYAFEEDELEEAEIQLLWSHAISRYFDLQTGLRYDFDPKGQAHAVLGVMGTAPYWIELDAATFLSTNGDLTASIEAEYEFALSARLHLRPRAEIGFSAQDIDALDTGAGFTNVDLGLRLSYDVVRELSPYIGVEWQASLGETRNIVQNLGEDPDRGVFVIGVSAWY